MLLYELLYLHNVHVHANGSITGIRVVDDLWYKYSIYRMIISTTALHAMAFHTTAVSVKIIKRALHLIISDCTYHESTQ